MGGRYLQSAQRHIKVRAARWLLSLRVAFPAGSVMKLKGWFA
jgi:hypothetical protein